MFTFFLSIVLIFVCLMCLAYLLGIFIFIPKNHIVCLVLKDNLVQYQSLSRDKDKILEAIKRIPDTEPRKVLALKDANGIVTRDTDRFWGLFVKFFNLHFTTLNPLVTLKQITIEKTHVNTEWKETDKFKDKIIRNGAEKTRFLRISWPRDGGNEGVDLKGGVSINLIWNVSEYTVWDLDYLFFVSTNVSQKLDEQTRQGVATFYANMSIVEFQGSVRSSNAASPLNQSMRDLDDLGNYKSGAGIYHVGLVMTGTIGIGDYQIDPKSQPVIDAQLEEVASQSALKTAENKGEAQKTLLIKAGEGEAEAIKLKGKETAIAEGLKTAEIAKAEAEGARLLGEQVRDNPELAGLLKRQALKDVGTLVLNETPNPTPTPMIINPNDPPKK